MQKLWLYTILLSLYTLGCGSKPRSVDVPLLISERADIYRALVSKTQDDDGFIDTKRCDSLLFSSLISTAGIDVNLEAAEVSPGEWLRRPISYPECYENRLSRSRVSRDMLLGVFWDSWAKGDLNRLQRIWDYGSANNWIMGTYRPLDLKAIGTMTMNPAYITLLARMIYALGGPDYTVRLAPIFITNSCEGFTCHLSVLYLLLLGEVSGLSSSQIDRLEQISIQNPQNLLFTAAAIKYGKHRPWLVNWSLYPADRLPDSSDRCETWATQRDDNDVGLQPCTKNELHSGGDLIFVDWILRRSW